MLKLMNFKNKEYEKIILEGLNNFQGAELPFGYPIPNEVLIYLFTRFLNPSETASLSLVCKSWRKFVRQENIWKVYCLQLENNLENPQEDWYSLYRVLYYRWHSSNSSQGLLFSRGLLRVTVDPSSKNEYHPVISRRGFASGVHSWKIKIEGKKSHWTCLGVSGPLPERRDQYSFPNMFCWSYWGQWYENGLTTKFDTSQKWWKVGDCVKLTLNIPELTLHLENKQTKLTMKLLKLPVYHIYANLTKDTQLLLVS